MDDGSLKRLRAKNLASPTKAGRLAKAVTDQGLSVEEYTEKSANRAEQSGRTRKNSSADKINRPE